MRKKKHLEEKLARCVNLIEFPPVTKDYREEIKEKAYLDFSVLFGNDHPVQMEIGCGKGRFITELGKREPGINFLAVEVNRSVLCSACELALAEHVDNVRFLHLGAEVLAKYIPPHCIGRIYLNFSCPFPKKAYENKRLTNLRFLESYKELLASGAEIHQKTDNMHFFEYSLEQYSLAGYKIKNVSLDLHAAGFEENIMTEYEKRFTDLGQPIYRLEAYL